MCVVLVIFFHIVNCVKFIIYNFKNNNICFFFFFIIIAHKEKTYLRVGLKEVQRRVRRDEKGLVIFAGDVSPIDIMSHMPGVCETKNLPYCYVPSREDLGSAMGVKRSAVMVLIRKHENYADLYDECQSEIKALPFDF